jgi:hypothetical protein
MDKIICPLCGKDYFENETILLNGSIGCSCQIVKIDYQGFLSNLLAVIHKDDGDYEENFGTEKAVKDAIDLLFRERNVHKLAVEGLREVMNKNT